MAFLSLVVTKKLSANLPISKTMKWAIMQKHKIIQNLLRIILYPKICTLPLKSCECLGRSQNGQILPAVGLCEKHSITIEPDIDFKVTFLRELFTEFIGDGIAWKNWACMINPQKCENNR